MKIISCLLFLSAFFVHGQKDYAKAIMDTLCSPHFDGRGYVNQGDSTLR